MFVQSPGLPDSSSDQMTFRLVSSKAKMASKVFEMFLYKTIPKILTLPNVWPVHAAVSLSGLLL